MKPRSIDLRQRIVNAVKNEKITPKEAAARFAVNLATVYRLLQLNRDLNSLMPAKPTGRPRTITSEQEPDLLQQIKDHSDATLEEHSQHWFEAMVEVRLEISFCPRLSIGFSGHPLIFTITFSRATKYGMDFCQTIKSFRDLGLRTKPINPKVHGLPYL